MQNKQLKGAKKVLLDTGPFLNKTKIAVECDCHPNTVDNYIKGKWSNISKCVEITHKAVKQFVKFKAKSETVWLIFLTKQFSDTDDQISKFENLRSLHFMPAKL